MNLSFSPPSFHTIHTSLGSSYLIAHVLHCPPSPPAHSFIIGTAVINTHKARASWLSRAKGCSRSGAGRRPRRLDNASAVCRGTLGGQRPAAHHPGRQRRHFDARTGHRPRVHEGGLWRAHARQRALRKSLDAGPVCVYYCRTYLTSLL